MKRTQLIKVFGVKDSFISLLTRAKFLKEFKPGVGKSIDYDQKKICLILIGFEMHKIGIAFRHIDEYLGHLNNRAWRSLLPRFQLWDKSLASTIFPVWRQLFLPFYFMLEKIHFRFPYLLSFPPKKKLLKIVVEPVEPWKTTRVYGTC